MKRGQIQARYLAWVVLPLAGLAVLAWQLTKTGPASLPEKVDHLPASALPPAAETPARPAPVDQLWQRYEALRQLPPSEAELAVPTPQTAPTTPESGQRLEAERRSQQLAVQRERRERLTEVFAARDQALESLQKLRPDDVEGMIGVLEAFNQRLVAKGAGRGIPLQGMQEVLRNSQKLARVNEQLLAEASRGAQANPARLQQLSRELRELQKAQLRAYRAAGMAGQD